MRTFLAVEVPPAVPSGDPQHLTLDFLGEIDERTAGRLDQELAPAVAAIPLFEFVLDGVGAFPNSERPRVVWRGVTGGAPELRSLAKVVRDVVASVRGGPEPEPFVPHVTLFRVRTPRDRERAARWLAPNAALPPAMVVPVRDVVLVESQLTPSGAIHRPRTRFPLAVVSR